MTVDADAARLIEALASSGWVARRQVIEQLAGLGREAVAIMCQSLRNDRRSEGRLAALVDALVASSAVADDVVLALLDDPNPAVVCDGLQIVGRRHINAALERVISLSAHDDDNVAVASIEALGQLDGPRSFECLLGLLSSASFFRSFPAIDVLGRLGDTRAVEPLLGLLGDPLRGTEAVRALGRLGDETAVVALFNWLAISQVSATRAAAVALASIDARVQKRYASRAALSRAIASHPHKEAIEVRLQRALSGADPVEAGAIGSLLGLFSSSTSVESLFRLLGEGAEASASAAESLGRLAHHGNSEVLEVARTVSSEERMLLLPQLSGVSAAVPWFVECLADNEPRVQVLACEALAKTGDPSSVSSLFALLGHADLSVNQAATGALQSLGSAQTEELALAMASSGTGARRHAALRVVSYFGSQRALPLLLAAAADTDERSREIAVSGLASIDGEEAVSGLLAVSRHVSARTRAAAVRALGNVEPTQETLARVLEATTDPDPWVRYQACQALGNAGNPVAASALSERLADAAGQVRVAAVDAIARLPGPPAREVLERAAQHEDLEVRRAALTGFGMTCQPSSLPLLIDAAVASDTATRLVAISSLAKYQSDEALARIVEVARRDQDAAVQSAAFELLSESTLPAATGALVELLFVDALRSRATEALMRRAPARAEQLGAALVNAPAAVAEAVVAVIARMPAPVAQPLLLAALSLPNEQARRAAVRALRVAFVAEPVLRALAHAASLDADPEVRRVAAARLS